jgi:hypothetical protein
VFTALSYVRRALTAQAEESKRQNPHSNGDDDDDEAEGDAVRDPRVRKVT